MKHAGPSGLTSTKTSTETVGTSGCGGLWRPGRLRRHGRLWAATASATGRPATPPPPVPPPPPPVLPPRRRRRQADRRSVDRLHHRHRRHRRPVGAAGREASEDRAGPAAAGHPATAHPSSRAREIHPRRSPTAARRAGRKACVFPHRLRDEPDVALEREPFAPRIASNRRAAARERARLKPIEAGHSVSGMRSRATSTRNVRVVLRRNGGPTCGS